MPIEISGRCEITRSRGARYCKLWPESACEWSQPDVEGFYEEGERVLAAGSHEACKAAQRLMEGRCL